MTRLAVGVASTAAMLLGLIVWETSPDHAFPAPPPDHAVATNTVLYTAAISAPPTAGVRDSLNTLLARPLVAINRRPATPAGTFLDRATPRPPRLAGIWRSPAARSAVFAPSSIDRKSAVAHEGDHLGDFIVLKIDVGAVRLLGPDGAEQLVTLSADPASRAAGVAVVAATTAPPRAVVTPAVLDLLRTIPGEAARLGPPGGPVPPQPPR